MDKQEHLADLTIDEFESLVRRIVQKAMAEVMIEFSVAWEREAELTFQAEMADLVRGSLRDAPTDTLAAIGDFRHPDD